MNLALNGTPAEPTLKTAGRDVDIERVNGTLQAHGLLLALSEPDLIIRLVSANASIMFGLSLEELLDRPLQAALGERQANDLKLRLVEGDLLVANPHRVVAGSQAKAFDCIAHRNEQMLVLEFEPVQPGGSLIPSNVAASLQASLLRMDRASDLLRLADIAANEVRRLSGFERVIIHRYAANWDGEIIAEAAPASARSYMNLRFPASDTPAQARDYFLANTLRLVADVQSLPVPVLPLTRPDMGRPLDLGQCVLRSALPVHLAYLRKLGVRAALTISIVVHTELWGMIVCHHGEPRMLDYNTRAMCDLVCQLLASQIIARTNVIELQSRLHSRDLIEAYMTDIENDKLPLETRPIVNERLMSLLDADGVMARCGNSVVVHGTIIDEVSFAPVLAKLRMQSTRGIASSDMLCSVDSAAGAFSSEASGALFLGLSETTDDYIVLFRRELISTVVWAGEPRKAAQVDDAPDVCHARTSFTAWQETVRGRSRPWTELDLDNARLLREQFVGVREAHERFKAEERVRYLALTDSLTQLANRTSIRDRLESCLSTAAAEGSQLAVLFIDLDKFKPFNDTFGHATGDRILQILAARMRYNVRADDVVGRLGGDEFMVVMPGVVSEQQAIDAAYRLCAAIARRLQLDHGPASITASIGISCYPSDATDLEALLRHSDAAMYDAKRAGGNAVNWYGGP